MGNWLDNSPYRYAYKPSLAQARLNYEHPMARGLQRLYLANENGGIKLNDLIAKDTINLNGNVPWQIGSDGGSVLAGSTASDFGLSSQTLNIAQCTVAVKMLYQTTVPTSGTRYIAGFCQGNGGSTFDKNLIYDSVSGVEFTGYDGATKTTGGFVLTANTWYTIAGTADGTNLRLWVNGVNKASTACGNTFTGYTGPNLLVSGAPGSLYTLWGFQVAAFAVWNRALTDVENRGFYANPYQLVARPTTRRFFVTSSTPSVPTNLALTVNGPTQITATWDAVAGATSYDLQYDLTNAFASPTTINTASPPVAAQPLTPSTTYYFRVRANNGAGSSAYSSAVSATTPATSHGSNHMGLDTGIGL